MDVHHRTPGLNENDWFSIPDWMPDDKGNQELSNKISFRTAIFGYGSGHSLLSTPWNGPFSGTLIVVVHASVDVKDKAGQGVSQHTSVASNHSQEAELDLQSVGTVLGVFFSLLPLPRRSTSRNFRGEHESSTIRQVAGFGSR